jgi:hypothetical protein
MARVAAAGHESPRGRYRTPRRREEDGPNRLGRKGDADRRVRRHRAHRTSEQAGREMPWLLGGAVRVSHQRVCSGGRPDGGWGEWGRNGGRWERKTRRG